MSEFFIFSRLNYLCFSLPPCLKLSSEGFFPYLQQAANIINSLMSVFPRQTSCKTSSPLSSAQAPTRGEAKASNRGAKTTKGDNTEYKQFINRYRCVCRSLYLSTPARRFSHSRSPSQERTVRGSNFICKHVQRDWCCCRCCKCCLSWRQTGATWWGSGEGRGGEVEKKEFFGFHQVLSTGLRH